MRSGVIAALLLTSMSARADIVRDPCACSPNKPHFHRASALTGSWGGERQTLLEHGLEIHGTYAPELYAAPGLQDQPLVSAGLFSLTLDADLARMTGKPLGGIHMSGLAIHGHGLSEQLMDIYGVSNNAAPEDIRLFEAWIEQPIGPLTVRAGQLSADQEFILADHATVLMSGTFGIVALMSADIGGPVYPVGAPGISARIEANGLVAKGAIYDGEQHNVHGIPTALEHALALGELQFGGLVQVGAWHHTVEGNGYYGILDHNTGRLMGGFLRVAYSPDSQVSLYVDTGFRLRMARWRPRDFASAGVAFAEVGQGNQALLELTYQVLVTGWLTIQPDIQFVFQHDRDAAVFATRAVIAL